ncbi:MAG: MBL fold metallo-hydrolase [Chloroflexi bacterium]|nr:MBL fold metallo-hydrolase [Chloroflexota bacterium]
MKVKWLGHATFLITAGDGTRIITDPYTTGDALNYGEIRETAEIVTMSHEHFDHNNLAAVKGKPSVVTGTAEVRGIKFRGIPTDHDEAGGSKRGKNTILCWEVYGVKLCHLGDLGHVLTQKQATEVGKVDVLLAPVGGYYTIDAAAATKICEQLKPAVVIPMHFKTDRVSMPISGVEEFLKGKRNVTRQAGSEAEFKAGKLPSATEVMVLRPAL